MGPEDSYNVNSWKIIDHYKKENDISNYTFLKYLVKNSEIILIL